jgi:hypothetical protein
MRLWPARFEHPYSVASIIDICADQPRAIFLGFFIEHEPHSRLPVRLALIISLHARSRSSACRARALKDDRRGGAYERGLRTPSSVTATILELRAPAVTVWRSSTQVDVLSAARRTCSWIRPGKSASDRANFQASIGRRSGAFSSFCSSGGQLLGKSESITLPEGRGSPAA